jgi:hypothetical protein
MTFTEWWNDLSRPEQKSIGEHNAKFVWEECQRYTLMTIEEACKAQVAYDQGVKDARERFEVRIAGWTLTPGVQPGMIWIQDAGGEGGDFHIHELAEVIGKFYREKF